MWVSSLQSRSYFWGEGCLVPAKYKTLTDLRSNFLLKNGKNNMSKPVVIRPHIVESRSNKNKSMQSA